MWWRSVVFTGLLFGGLIAGAIHALWLICFVGGKLASLRVPYAPFGWTALAVVLILWSLLAYGRYVGMWQVEVKEVEYASTEVPEAFDGYKIAHISDLHVDTYYEHPEKLQAIADKVNEQGADVILFTGDMSTGRLCDVFMHEAALSSFKARDGVKSVLGNHDFFIYDRQYKTMRERCAAADTLTAYEQDKLGWQVLRNEHVVINRGGDSIVIAGVDNIAGRQGFRTIQRGDLGKALAGTDGLFTVLMSHDPGHWTAEVLPNSKVQITLSGHTHAAQVRLFGWSMANLMFGESDGRYDRDGRMLYVNPGIGCTAPFRIGCPSQITVITLKHK